jgi:hypothetical protein
VESPPLSVVRRPLIVSERLFDTRNSQSGLSTFDLGFTTKGTKDTKGLPAAWTRCGSSLRFANMVLVAL